MTRKCKKCNFVGEIEEFPKAGFIKGKQYYRHLCSECYCGQKSSRRTKIRQWFNKFKNSLFCKECGENDFRLLDFHHRSPKDKDFSIGDILNHGYSIDKLKKEIEKCVVL